MASSPNWAIPAQPHVRTRRSVGFRRSRGLLAAFDPGFDFLQIPYDAAGGQAESAREFAALLHLVDRCLGQGHDLVQLSAADGAPERQRRLRRKLGKVVVAGHTRMGQRYRFVGGRERRRWHGSDRDGMRCCLWWLSSAIGTTCWGEAGRVEVWMFALFALFVSCGESLWSIADFAVVPASCISCCVSNRSHPTLAPGVPDHATWPVALSCVASSLAARVSPLTGFHR